MKTSKNKELPVYHSVTEFLKGQASRIFKEVKDNDSVVIVNKQNKPYAVVISYDRYKRVKEKFDTEI